MNEYETITKTYLKHGTYFRCHAYDFLSSPNAISTIGKFARTSDVGPRSVRDDRGPFAKVTDSPSSN